MIEHTTFNDGQKEYLKGFFEGVNQRPEGVPFLGQNASGQFTNQPSEAEANVHGTPIDDLCKEELVKHERNGLDCWEAMVANGEKNEFPQGGDVFRYKFYGFFHVAPTQDSFMMRCRIPGCVLRDYQLQGLAEIAEDWGGGYSDITTRGNFQIREIEPKNVVPTYTKRTDLGVASKGSGADNVRNITATPTSGFDPQELHHLLVFRL